MIKVILPLNHMKLIMLKFKIELKVYKEEILSFIQYQMLILNNNPIKIILNFY